MTTDPAAMIVPLFIGTPGMTVTFAPIQQPSLITVGAENTAHLSYSHLQFYE
ncbi:Hypothetical protein EfmE4453_1048 [Enterococcus faecium E4453]|nr:Hypothetical protein EfmE4453_1048 [Enterococcus faecium E4453]